MKTIAEKNIKIQKYKNEGGKVVVTTTSGDTTTKQEIKSSNPEKFKQITNNVLNLPSDNTKYIE